MIVHSFIYYRMGTSIIDDHQWQFFANDLMELQKEYGQTWGFYDKDFADWNGATGCHLSQEPWVDAKAHWLVKYHGGLL